MNDKVPVAELRLKIAEKLRNCNLNVSQLAQMTNLSNAEMLRIVQGNDLPSMETLRKLSEELNIPLSYFFE